MNVFLCYYNCGVWVHVYVCVCVCMRVHCGACVYVVNACVRVYARAFARVSRVCMRLRIEEALSVTERHPL